jgi:predicted AAA+ superfamily ATPase
MIPRKALQNVLLALERQAAVALIGPRQVGKTTLALAIAQTRPSLYLDLESPEDRAKLTDPILFLSAYEDRLVILDEIHRTPDIFRPLRSLIDQGRQKGKRTGRFLILGSASMDLLKQASETLAGRIAFVDLNPFDVREVGDSRESIDRLWVRGGFPESYLAATDELSFAWRKDFIRTYLERDVPQFGPRIATETLRRLWTMLAHQQGALLNTSALASALSISGQTISRYLDLLVYLLLVRRLAPFYTNIGKRLVKSPKIYIRDSGLLHSLLGIPDYNTLAGHPVLGQSWEGFVIENIVSAAPEQTRFSFYRTAAGAEVDLVMELPKGELWAVEVKYGLAPALGRGFHNARADLKPTRSLVVYSGQDRFPLSEGIEAIGLGALADLLSAQG